MTDAGEIKASLTQLLDECLEGMNQENSFKVTGIDLNTMKLSVDFDIVIVEEDDYVGFAGY